jgi:hypothetical protein
MELYHHSSSALSRRVCGPLYHCSSSGSVKVTVVLQNSVRGIGVEGSNVLTMFCSTDITQYRAGITARLFVFR